LLKAFLHFFVLGPTNGVLKMFAVQTHTNAHEPRRVGPIYAQALGPFFFLSKKHLSFIVVLQVLSNDIIFKGPYL